MSLFSSVPLTRSQSHIPRRGLNAASLPSASDNVESTFGHIGVAVSPLADLAPKLQLLYGIDKFESRYVAAPFSPTDAWVDELEGHVNDLKALGIKNILINSTSTEIAPFIDGTQASLNNVPSDERHPGIRFFAVRQGSASVDNSANWYRAGADFKSGPNAATAVLLPDVTGFVPQPIFLLVTDGDAAVTSTNTTWTDAATANGYSVQTATLTPSGGGFTAGSLTAAEAATAAIVGTAQSVVGWSMTSGNGFSYLDAFTTAANTTHPGLATVSADITYVPIAYTTVDLSDVTFGDGSLSGAVAVDLVNVASHGYDWRDHELWVSPDLQRLGFPPKVTDAAVFDTTTYGDDGLVFARTWAAVAQGLQRGLDADDRYKINSSRQLVEFYVFNSTQAAGASYLTLTLSNQIVNPLWLS